VHDRKSQFSSHFEWITAGPTLRTLRYAVVRHKS
jgi:hypothetical protein